MRHYTWIRSKVCHAIRNRLRGSDIGRMTGDVITGCGCWTNAAIIFKNAASLAACYWHSSFKKSSISLEEVSEASVLSVFIVSLISVKRLSVCPLDFFLLADVSTYFLFAFHAPSEDLEEEPWLPSSSQTSSWLSSGLASWPLVSEAFIPGSIACWCWQMSIELKIGNNLPNQLPVSLSCWKCLIPDGIFTFITASLQILMQRLNFCRVCSTLTGNSSLFSLHLSFVNNSYWHLSIIVFSCIYHYLTLCQIFFNN